MTLSKFVDTLAIVLLLLLVLAGFMIMKNTAESNLVTADIALIQAKHKKKTLQEVGLLRAEIVNLQKEIGNLEESVKSRTENPDADKVLRKR